MHTIASKLVPMPRVEVVEGMHVVVVMFLQYNLQQHGNGSNRQKNSMIY